MSAPTWILGGGVTGLAAGRASGLPVLEAAAVPGGICSSYYLRPGTTTRLPTPPPDGDAYRFEIGGGHWIFGGDPRILRFIRALTPVRAYRRRSAIYFAASDTFVPYPIQHHLHRLGPDVAAQALREMLNPPAGTPRTMAEALAYRFGPTLTDRFFGPFHARYTAGLWERIAFQDGYKSPLNLDLVIRGAFDGAFDPAAAVGYNVEFIYPEDGLGALMQRLAAGGDVRYGHEVVRIDPAERRLFLADGRALAYERLLATLPLRRMLALTGLSTDAPPDPYTSVLVLNLGAVRGPRCPEAHWLYVPDAPAGFHRVGFYSNVDPHFLPAPARADGDRVSLYVETAFEGGTEPTDAEIARRTRATVEALQAWGFIGEVEVADPTWIPYAYTWAWPGSTWREEALARLRAHDIWMAGRYGRWVFQGIADSLQEGLWAGAAMTTEAV